MKNWIPHFSHVLGALKSTTKRGTGRNPAPLPKYFRSIVVLGNLHASIDGDTYANQLSRWIERFNAFSRLQFGFDHGQNPLLAASRTILFMGDDVLSATNEQLALCSLVRRMGFASTVRIPVAEALARPGAFSELLAPESAVSTMLLDSRTHAAVDSPSELKMLVSECVRAGKALSLTGTISYWLDSGLLADQGVNGDGFSLGVISGQNDTRPTVSTFDPCASRFQVFISESGGLFPCQGLVGTSFGQIGHITAQNPNIFSVTDWAELDGWAKHGPSTDGATTHPPGVLPVICRRHRKYLERREAAPQRV